MCSYRQLARNRAEEIVCSCPCQRDIPHLSILGFFFASITTARKASVDKKARWGRGQLENELERGSTPAIPPSNWCKPTWTALKRHTSLVKKPQWWLVVLFLNSFKKQFLVKKPQTLIRIAVHEHLPPKDKKDG